MTLYLCLDDRGGMLFNNRRQSRDAALLADMAASCDETVWLRALNASKHRFTTEDLDHLHYNTDNVILVRIAQECGLKLPKDLAEEWAEEQAEEEAFELSQKNYDRKGRDAF